MRGGMGGRRSSGHSPPDRRNGEETASPGRKRKTALPEGRADKSNCKYKEQRDAKMKSIISTTQGCSKAFEEFKRRTAELSSQHDALNKRYDSFINKSAEAKAGAEKLRLEMSAMTKAARASGAAKKRSRRLLGKGRMERAA